MLRIDCYGPSSEAGDESEGSCKIIQGADGGDLDYEVAVDSQMRGAQKQSQKDFFFSWMGCGRSD